MQQQHHVSCISKGFLLKLFSVDGSDQLISRPTFCRICKRHQLHVVAGMSEKKWNTTRIFCVKESKALLEYFKFEPKEITDAM